MYMNNVMQNASYSNHAYIIKINILHAITAYLLTSPKVKGSEPDSEPWGGEI